LIAAARVRLVPVGGPFPDVAAHVKDAIGAASRTEAADGDGAPVTGGPGIGFLRVQIVSPGVDPAIGATGCLLPLCFGGQSLARPLTVGQGVVPAHLDRRVVVFALGVKTAPTSPTSLFLVGLVAGRLDKGRELGIGHFKQVYLKGRQVHLLLRRLIRVIGITAHDKGTSRDHDHLGGADLGRRGVCGDWCWSVGDRRWRFSRPRLSGCRRFLLLRLNGRCGLLRRRCWLFQSRSGQWRRGARSRRWSRWQRARRICGADLRPTDDHRCGRGSPHHWRRRDELAAGHLYFAARQANQGKDHQDGPKSCSHISRISPLAPSIPPALPAGAAHQCRLRR